MRLVRAADMPPVPWRNGGGLTRELLAWPSPADWRLRLSVADVAQDGPFSPYPGVTRAFAILQGAGVVLTFADATHTVRPGDAPLVFDGQTAPGCRLLDGPVRDLNLMARGGRCALLAVDATPWHPPRGARAGLFTRVGGTWRAGAETRQLSAHTLLFTDTAAGHWTFQPHQAADRAAWWFSHEDTNP